MQGEIIALVLLAGLCQAGFSAELTLKETKSLPANNGKLPAKNAIGAIDTISLLLPASKNASPFSQFNSLAREAFTKGDYTGAAEHWKTARRLGMESSAEDAAIATANLATLEYSQGNLRAALVGYREALRFWDSAGNCGEAMRATLRHMADTLRILGEYEEARRLLSRLSEILAHASAPDSNAIAGLRLSSARLESSAGQSSAAANLYRQILADPPADLSLRAAAWEGLSEVCLSQGKLHEADQAIREALSLWDSMGQRIRVASTANRMGDRWIAMRKPGKAIPYLLRALAVFEEKGITGAQLASTLNNLGQAYRFDGDVKAALRYFDRALSVATRDLSANHHFRASILVNLGDFALSRKKFDEAERYLRQALSIDELRLGNQDPASAREIARDIARDLARLAHLHLLQKQYDEACREFGNALSLRERTQLPLDPEQADWFEIRANLLRRSENYVEAARLETKAMQIRVQHALR